jgi:hypothetical protein
MEQERSAMALKVEEGERAASSAAHLRAHLSVLQVQVAERDRSIVRLSGQLQRCHQERPLYCQYIFF